MMPSGIEAGVEAWAIDSGYSSHAVYNFVRSRHGVFAIDGRDGRTAPIIGTPKRVDVNWGGKIIKRGVMLWPLGTYPLKADHYGAIRKTIAGPDEYGAWAPGSMILPGEVDQTVCEQLTAEYLKKVERKNGAVDYQWKKLAGRDNEQLDMACYARAMAEHLGLGRLKLDGWEQLRAERGGVQADAQTDQPDLFAVSVKPPETPTQPAVTGTRRRGIRGRAS